MEDRTQYEQADALFNDPANLKLVKSTLYRVFPKPNRTARRKGLDLEDLMQYGYTGLWKACITYDPTKGAAFQTHAINHIRWHLIDRVKRECNPMKLQINVKYVFSDMYKIVSFDRVMEDLFEGEVTLHDIQADERVDVFGETIDSLTAQELMNVMESEDDLIILKMRAKKIPFPEIGKLFGCTGQNIQHKFKKIKARLNEYRQTLEVANG